MIRNAKANVTDLRAKLFQSPNVTSETYQYSEAEARFYGSDSVHRGWPGLRVGTGAERAAYGNARAHRDAEARIQLDRCNSPRGQASLGTNADGEREVDRLQQLIAASDDAEGSGDRDAVAELEEHCRGRLQCPANEGRGTTASITGRCRRLNRGRNKTRRLLEVGQNVSGRTILFFTEYKATQAALLSELLAAFGPETVTFINGDERLDAY